MLFENLESRQLFSAYVDPTSHALIVQGTNGGDNIHIWNSFGPMVNIQINGGAVQSFDWTAVTKMQVYGLDGNDTIDASGFRPVDYTFPCEFYGGNGSDIMTGGDAMNLFDGGADRDWMTGSALLGTDTVSYETRTGNVQVYLDNPFGGSGEAYEWDGLSNIENVRCGSGNDVVYGTAANNNIYGNGGNDTLYGNGGDDYIEGGKGGDILVGGDGSDFLNAHDGVAGNDKVYGDNMDGTGSGFDMVWIDKKTFPFFFGKVKKLVTFADRVMSGADAVQTW
jgi:Ca2+-binding RTX toxin-like protein